MTQIDNDSRPQNGLEAQLRRLVEEAMAGTSQYLVELRVRGHANAPAIDIVVDSDEGVTIAQCAEISRHVNRALDASGLAGEAYSLNVSSPGADRPLVLPRQYRKNVGRTLRVVVREAEASQTLTGQLVEVDDDGIVLAVPEPKGKKASQESRRIPYEQIVQARVQLPW